MSFFNQRPSIKSVLRFPRDYPLAKRLAAGVDDPSRPVVTLSLATDALLIDASRHLASLGIACDRAGHNVALRCTPLRLATISRKIYGRMFLEMPNVFWQSSELWHSSGDDFSSAARWSDLPHEDWRQICVGRNLPETNAKMPYPRHPRIEMLDQPLAGLRGDLRSIRVFFGGNTKASYGRSSFSSYDGLLNRLEVLQIAASVNSRDVHLRDVNVDPIAPPRWLPQVADADFFLCPPGSSQPVCHHLAEALSVGTIPILQYADLVDDDLLRSGGVIGFDDADGLRHAINRAVTMSPDEIAERRRAAIRFYDDQFDHPRFVAGLIAESSSSSSQPIAMRFHHVDLFENQSPVAA